VRPLALGGIGDPSDRRLGGGDPAAEVDGVTDLHRALALLSVEQRAVVGLHYLADLTLAEVSSTLGIPEGTAKSRLHAALAVLRRRMGERP
jgi:RNA polymerase sigma-70 factor, ECF subfamily